MSNTLPLPLPTSSTTSSTRYSSALDDGVMGRSSPACAGGMATPTLPLSLPLPPNSTPISSSSGHHHQQATLYGTSPHGANGRYDGVGGGNSGASPSNAVSSSSCWDDPGNGGVPSTATSLVHQAVRVAAGRSKKEPSYSSSSSVGGDGTGGPMTGHSSGRQGCGTCCGGGVGSLDAASRAKHQQQQRRCCLRKLKAFFLVGVPMLGVVTSSLAWFYASRQALATIQLENDLIRRQTLELGKLIINFNIERELTVIYVTARTSDTQSAAKHELDVARQRTDQALSSLITWPAADYPDVSAANMFRSPHLFAAILGGHRDAVRVGVYFWDEVQFYADLIDVIIGWLDRDIACRTATGSSSRQVTASTGNSDVSLTGGGLRVAGRLNGLLQSYGYLMASVGYIGAEQALCSVFHSVVCFSHRETFYYANYSFAGESLFRLYRHSYPPENLTPLTRARETPTTESRRSGSESVAAVQSPIPSSLPPPPPPPEPRPSGWRSADHRTFFPELSTCRRDIVADLDYIGASTDPSLCSPTRKNETRFSELDVLVVDEHERLVDDIAFELYIDETSAARYCTLTASVTGGVFLYVLIAVVLRCVVRAGRRCAVPGGGSSAAGCDGGASARRRKRKLVQQASSPIPTESSWCPGATTMSAAAAEASVIGVDSDLLLRQLASGDGGCCRLPNDVVENNHRNSHNTETSAYPNNFPAMKVACV